MSLGKVELISAMQDLIEAHARGREVMDKADSLLRFGILQLESDGDFMEMMAKVPTATERQVTQDAFKKITDARHAIRLLLLEVCLEQGLSPREVGETWGVSRQRVAKYVAELKEIRSTQPEPSEATEYVHSSTIQWRSD